jgi:pimeloyl-ACP methyl ester carboxylesterase
VADRSHLIHPEIDVESHVVDIVNLIRWEELQDIVLVGHSYGGMVISGVAEKVPDGTIKSIVYLDALYTDDGQCMADTSPGFEDVVGPENPIPAPPAALFGYEGDIARKLESLMTSQPRHTLFRPLRIRGTRERVPIKTYIFATEGRLPGFPQMYERLRDDPTWRTETLPCKHDTMFDMPNETADALLRAARS